jgi:RNA polymerase sigma-70 factor (ECF subfamily)
MKQQREREMLVAESDEELLSYLIQGDISAFEELFRRYYSLIYRVLFNLVGSREQAEDLVQETFLTLYHNPPRHSGEDEKLSAWLYRVALNRGYNAIRSEKRHQQRMERMKRIELPAQADDPSAMVVRAEECAAVHAALAQLPERQRNILLLRYAGLSYAEIASVLRIATSSIGTLLARAERKFLQVYQNRDMAVQLAEGEHYESLL